MEKKLYKNLKTIILEENVLQKLNEILESMVLNCKVLVIVDFLTFQKYNHKLEEIKSCALNCLEIKVLSVFSKIEEICLDESVGFVVGIGENQTLKTVSDFAIKNNISYGLVNLFLLKSDILMQKNGNLDSFLPNFVLIEKNNLSLKDKFFMFCDLFSYSKFLLENSFNFENLKLKEFCKQYVLLLQNFVDVKDEFDDEFFYKKFIAHILLVHKYKIVCKKKYKNDYKNFVSNFFLVLCYKNIFLSLNCKNLNKANAKNLDKVLLDNYDQFDFAFYKTYLINFKQKFLSRINLSLNFNLKLLNFLKENFFSVYYQNVKSLQQIELNKDLFENTFLKKMSYFELFNKVLKI